MARVSLRGGCLVTGGRRPARPSARQASGGGGAHQLADSHGRRLCSQQHSGAGLQQGGASGALKRRAQRGQHALVALLLLGPGAAAGRPALGQRRIHRSVHGGGVAQVQRAQQAVQHMPVRVILSCCARLAQHSVGQRARRPACGTSSTGRRPR